MKQDKTPLLDDEDWKKFFLKNDYAEIQEINAYRQGVNSTNRLFSPSYLKDAGSKKQEAVFKIIGGGIGRTQITRLALYINRKLAEQAEQEDLKMYKDGIELEDEETQKIINKWVKNFEAPKSLENQSWKIDKLGQMEEQRQKLQIKKEREGLSEEEDQNLLQLNAGIKGKFFLKDLGENEPSKKIDLSIRAKDDFKHLLFSTGGKYNAKKLHAAFEEFVNNTLESKGYDAMYQLHQDTEHDHFHVILNPRNKLHNKSKIVEDRKGSYFHPDRADLFAIRREFAHYMRKHGVEMVSTRRKDRPKALEQIKTGAEKLVQQQEWYSSRINPKEGSPSFDALKSRANMLKSIEYLQKQGSIAVSIGAGIKGKGKEHREHLNILSAAKKELLKPLDSTAIEATVNSLKKQDKLLKDKTEEAENMIKKEKLESKRFFFKSVGEKSAKRTKSSFKEMMEQHHRDITNAVKELAKQKTRENKKDVEEALKVLKALQKSKHKKVKR